MKTTAIPAFNDNYLWLFHAQNSKRAYVVDPGDAKPVEEALSNQGLELAGIIVTHHHWDHTDGIAALTEHREIPVYGPLNTDIQGITCHLSDGDTLALSDNLSFEVMTVPGHTLDHIAYYCASHKTLFCGDTLFAGGCGRLFEGTPEQMYNSLKRLAQLPSDTGVYCTHEYTQANLNFAVAVEPNNPALTKRQKAVQTLRDQGVCTLPSTISLECDTNPFLRCHKKDIINSVQRQTQQTTLTPLEVFTGLRAWKDNF